MLNARVMRDSLYIQYQELEAQLRGISPKLSLHKTISEQMAAIKQRLGGQIAPTKLLGIKKIQSLNGTPIVVREGPGGRPKNYALANLKCSHRIETQKCKVEGCERNTTGKGKCKSCGQSRYSNYCKGH